MVTRKGISLAVGVKNMEQPEQPAPTPPKVEPQPTKVESQPKAQERPFTTGLSIDRELYYLLQDVALKRSRAHGGRASVSAIIVELVQQHRRDLEKELKG